MKNRLSGTHKYGIIVAAVVGSLVIMLAGLATGLYGAIRMRREAAQPPANSDTAQHLLVDAAAGLKSSMSALRLCNEEEAADEVTRTALVHAVRAETALECTDGDWLDSRNKQAFLNDIAEVLHSYKPLETVELSDKLYECAERFYQSVADGSTFEYDGELSETENDEFAEATDEDIEKAGELVESALDCARVEYVGAFDGHIEYYVEKNGQSGYAMVCGDKVFEYSFSRGEADGTTSTDKAEQLALDAAERCGYRDLEVKWSSVTGKSTSVLLCKSYDGALACDDYATAVIFGDEVVSFTAGNCECEHKDIPSVKKSESEARGASGSENEGVLVVRKVNGKERVCYEYKIELEDGVHYVYVCAENGKQMQVK